MHRAHEIRLGVVAGNCSLFLVQARRELRMARTDEDGLVIEDTCFSFIPIPGFSGRCGALLEVIIILIDNWYRIARQSNAGRARRTGYMSSKELCEIALRVLKAWTYRELPAFSDIETLRQSCLPDESDVPIDELACRVITRECKAVIQNSQTKRKGIMSSLATHRKKAS